VTGFLPINLADVSPAQVGPSKELLPEGSVIRCTVTEVEQRTTKTGRAMIVFRLREVERGIRLFYHQTPEWTPGLAALKAYAVSRGMLDAMMQMDATAFIGEEVTVRISWRGKYCNTTLVPPEQAKLEAAVRTEKAAKGDALAKPKARPKPASDPLDLSRFGELDIEEDEES